MPVRDAIDRACQVPGCKRKFRAKGLCASHWAQLSRGNQLSVITATPRKSGSPPKIICDEVGCPNMGTPCHVFRGKKQDNGYGLVSIKRKKKLLHRYVWERECGPIPAGLVIDHMCRNRACCNIEHMRVVTQKVNVTENSNSIQAVNAAKTHCKHGHEFTPTNTYRDKRGRACRACKLQWYYDHKS